MGTGALKEQLKKLAYMDDTDPVGNALLDTVDSLLHPAFGQQIKERSRYKGGLSFTWENEKYWELLKPVEVGSLATLEGLRYVNQKLVAVSKLNTDEEVDSILEKAKEQSLVAELYGGQIVLWWEHSNLTL